MNEKQIGTSVEKYGIIKDLYMLEGLCTGRIEGLKRISTRDFEDPAIVYAKWEPTKDSEREVEILAEIREKVGCNDNGSMLYNICTSEQSEVASQLFSYFKESVKKGIKTELMGSTEFRLWLARLPDLNEKGSKELAQDPNPRVRKELASRGDLSEEVRELLTKGVASKTRDTKEVGESREDDIGARCSKRIEEILTRDDFLVTKDNIDDILHGDYKYPDFADANLKMLLTKLLNANAHEIVTGVYEDRKNNWSFDWGIHFFTSPKQLKIIWRDRIQCYPSFMLRYGYSEKSGKKDSGFMGFKIIQLGHVLTLIRNCDHTWSADS